MVAITDKLLPAGNKNRPGTPISPKKIIIHRTGNPGASALANRSYWIHDPNWHSAHYIVDSQGIFRCIPENEKAYHCAGANGDGIGIEICELPGPSVNPVTYRNVLNLIVEILLRRKWQPTDEFIQPHSKYDNVNRRFDPFNWLDYKAGKHNPGKELFDQFVFYADLKTHFRAAGGKLWQS